MAQGLVRYQQCGCFHFITFSCYRRQPLLNSAATYGVFEREFEAVRVRYSFVVAGYVKLKYMQRNPVSRGLVAKPEDWPWSSFRHDATGLCGVIEIESQWTAHRRGNQLPDNLRHSKKES